jgi:hypothetical protein
MLRKKIERRGLHKIKYNKEKAFIHGKEDSKCCKASRWRMEEKEEHNEKKERGEHTVTSIVVAYPLKASKISPDPSWVVGCFLLLWKFAFRFSLVLPPLLSLVLLLLLLSMLVSLSSLALLLLLSISRVNDTTLRCQQRNVQNFGNFGFFLKLQIHLMLQEEK